MKSSIVKKYVMALSGLFLMLFLFQHFCINATSLFSADLFNNISHFMGTNPLIQYAIQPILILGVVVHFIMGFVLELDNKGARKVGYAMNNGAANSSWSSRNMIWSGLVILAFIVLHFIDFWFPEINTKFIQGDWSGMIEGVDGYRYFTELQHKFVNPARVGAYVVAFVLLIMHLLHGFNSAFQSLGANNKYTRAIKGLGKVYAIGIPVGFIIIALFHHFNH
jgi:succinate dehydrogenase / fumarate reductase cytochrome b subunit